MIERNTDNHIEIVVMREHIEAGFDAILSLDGDFAVRFVDGDEIEMHFYPDFVRFIILDEQDQ